MILKKKKFIKQCPAEDCKGFLSTGYKCGICSIFVCSKCHEIIGKDKLQKTCNENNIKTVEMLKKDTKGCPACGIPIHKISGCDQMFCTKCHIAFSWKTGRQVTGVIHNPHFYEWQKETGNNNMAPGTVMCGGLPSWFSYKQKLKSCFPIKKQICIQDGQEVMKNCMEYKTVHDLAIRMHRYAGHFQDIELDGLRRNCQTTKDNKDIRIKYLLKEITEKSMRSTLSRRDKKYHKENDILQIYEVFNNVLRDIITKIYENPKCDNILNNFNELNRCIDFCNYELKKIGVRYNNCVPIIPLIENSHLDVINGDGPDMFRIYNKNTYYFNKNDLNEKKKSIEVLKCQKLDGG